MLPTDFDHAVDFPMLYITVTHTVYSRCIFLVFHFVRTACFVMLLWAAFSCRKNFAAEKRVIIKATIITSSAVSTKYKNSIFKPTIKVIIFQTGLTKVTSTLSQTRFLTCGHISQHVVVYTY